MSAVDIDSIINLFISKINSNEQTSNYIFDEDYVAVAELKRDFEGYIANQVRKARIDELEHIVSGSEYSADDFDWYEKTQDEYTGTRYYSEVRHLSKTDRIAELKRSKE